MKPETEPKLTFWSIPPFRQRAQAVARTIKLRDVRLLLVQFYGMLYFLYGLKIPAVLMIVVPSIIGASLAAKIFVMTVVPYLIFAMLACGLTGALVGAGAAWIITGRAMLSCKQNRLRWASWGALGAAAPVVPMVAAVPTARLLIVAGFVMLLFGAGIGFVFHWIVQRDRRGQNRTA